MKSIWHEWSDEEVAQAIAGLRRYPRPLTSLDNKKANNFHVLLYRHLWGERLPLGGWIVATKDEKRMARIFGDLCRERAAPVRKPVERVEVTKRNVRVKR